MNQMTSVADVAELLKFLAGANSLSSRVQQECKEAFKVLEKNGAVAGQIITGAAAIVAPGNVPPPPVLSSIPVLMLKPWKHAHRQDPIVNTGGNPFLNVQKFLDMSNTGSCIVEIEHIAISQYSSGIYDVLYRYKN